VNLVAATLAVIVLFGSIGLLGSFLVQGQTTYTKGASQTLTAIALKIEVPKNIPSMLESTKNELNLSLSRLKELVLTR